MGVQADILAALKTSVDTVSNIGKTYSRQRYVADWSNYLDLFKVTIGGVDQIRAWMLMPDEANVIIGQFDEFSRIKRTYNVLIAGFLGLDDSADTEGTFLALCESIMDNLDALETLSGVTGVTVGAVGPCLLRRSEIRQLGSPLCHYAEILVPVETTKAI